MKHINILKLLPKSDALSLTDKFTGKYYTDERVALITINAVINLIKCSGKREINISDPFAGDGRLIKLLIQQWNLSALPEVTWNVYLFDINSDGLDVAEKSMYELKNQGVNINLVIRRVDIFHEFQQYKGFFDCVVTNPPWESLKPDSRELDCFSHDVKLEYINSIKEFDEYLSAVLPASQPKRKFAGWGTNLSRAGAELSLDICKNEGAIGIVMPASFFADEQSYSLRKKFIDSGEIIEINYFPAEAKLYDGADVSSCSFIYKKYNRINGEVKLTVYDKRMFIKNSGSFSFSNVNNDSLSIPISQGVYSIDLLSKMKSGYSTWSFLEKKGDIWAGREIDETGSKYWAREDNGKFIFIKGKMIGRYHYDDDNKLMVMKELDKIPASSKLERIAWRDVSRPSQKRRMIATIIPPNSLAGNSLGVVYVKNGSNSELLCLLGIMNSLCFEFQLRSFLATGHVSLSALRMTSLPSKSILSQHTELADIVRLCLYGGNDCEVNIEAYVAKKIYGLSLDEYTMVLSSFEKLTLDERKTLLEAYSSYE